MSGSSASRALYSKVSFTSIRARIQRLITTAKLFLIIFYDFKILRFFRGRLSVKNAKNAEGERVRRLLDTLHEA